MTVKLCLSLIALCCFSPALLAATAYQWEKPDWVSEPVVPKDNPMSAAKVALGRYLFYDKRLSADNKMACATCHKQDKAFTDGKALSAGVNGEDGVRSAMSLANLAYLLFSLGQIPTKNTWKRNC
jgi:cytochrome c peroxidase